MEFFKSNLIAIYFALGAMSIYVLILYVDRLIQGVPKKRTIQSDDANDKLEVEKGIQSLDQALHDKVINEEEYEKFKSDLVNKHHQ